MCSGRVDGDPLRIAAKPSIVAMRASRYITLKSSLASWIFALSLLCVTTVSSDDVTFTHQISTEVQQTNSPSLIQWSPEYWDDGVWQLDWLQQEGQAEKNDWITTAAEPARERATPELRPPEQEVWSELEWETEVASAEPTDAAGAEPMPLQKVFAGYDQGFVIAGGPDIKLDADSQPFRLRINGWGHLRQSVLDSHNANPDLNQLEIKRARIVFSGHAFTTDLTYFVQIDGRSNAGERLYFLDYFLDYDIGHGQFDLPERALGMKAGLYKLPFSFSRWASGKELQFADRSMASIFFDINRSLAWGLYGHTDALPSPLDWEIALGNGFTTGLADTGNSGQLDNNMAISGRVSSIPIGTWGGNDMADLEYHEQLTTRIGGGFAVSTIDRSGAAEFSSQTVVDSGRPLANILPLAASSYTASLYSLDASLKYRGLSLTNEYYFRHISDIRGVDLPTLFDHGMWLEAGYFLVPNQWQVLSRWSRVQGNSGTLGGRDRSSDEVAVGLARYFRGQNIRLTVDATHLNGAAINSPVLDIAPGDDGWLYRTQLQFGF